MGIKKAFERLQRKVAVRKEREKELRVVESTALHKARLVEAVTLGQERARIEREEQISRLKKGISGGGVVDRFARRINIAAENLGYAKHKNPLKSILPKSIKKKKGKKKSRRINHSRYH